MSFLYKYPESSFDISKLAVSIQHKRFQIFCPWLDREFSENRQNSNLGLQQSKPHTYASPGPLAKCLEGVSEEQSKLCEHKYRQTYGLRFALDSLEKCSG